MTRHAVVALLIATVCLAACQTGDHYYWGHYEDVVYVDYAQPGKLSPESQISTLEEDIRDAAAANKPIPPGVHAHLGNLYFQVGKLDLAQKEFETEKAMYPESSTLMNRMIQHLSAKKPS